MKAARWVVGLLVLGTAGCIEDPGLVEDNFDFRLMPRTVVVVRSDPESHAIRVTPMILDYTSDEDEAPKCEWTLPEPPPGITFTMPEEQDLCTAFEMTFTVTSGADVGVRTAVLEGEWSKGIDVETVRHTLTLDIRSELSVAITAPETGTTVSAGAVPIEADIATVYGDIDLVEVLVGSAAPKTVFTGDPDAAVSTLSLATTADVPAGEEDVVVRATNTFGNRWDDTVHVTAVGSQVVRWDGEGEDGLWSNPVNWEGDVLPGPTSAVAIDDATADVRYDLTTVTQVASLLNRGRLTLTTGGLRLSGASTIEGELDLEHDLAQPGRPLLQLDDTLTLKGSLRCSQGDISGGRIDDLAGASMEVANCGWEDLAVDNASDILVRDYFLNVRGSTVLTNQAGATLRFEDGGVSCGVPCGGSIVNQGSMTVAGFRPTIQAHVVNSGTIDFGTAALELVSGESTGTITSAGGSLALRGNWSMEPGSSLTAQNVQLGPGALSLAGAMNVTSMTVLGSSFRVLEGATVSGFENLGLSTGELTLDPGVDVEVTNLQMVVGTISVGVNGNLNVLRILDWYEGTLSGSGTTWVSRRDITQGEATLNLRGSGPMVLDGQTLMMLGAAIWFDGDITAGNGAELVISASSFGRGLLQIYGDYAFHGDALAGAPTHIVNDGTIEKVDGVGQATIEACYEEIEGARLIEDKGSIVIIQKCTS